ncbi:hypothetical protein GmHk_03G006367 [Glycine max]|nr:hypothetical protein GmHk_03G006367 [Glycine max]
MASNPRPVFKSTWKGREEGMASKRGKKRKPYRCFGIAVAIPLSFLSQKVLILISKLHEHMFVFLLSLSKLKFFCVPEPFSTLFSLGFLAFWVQICSIGYLCDRQQQRQQIVLSVQKINFFCVPQFYLTVIEYSFSFARQKPQIIICWIDYRFIFSPHLLMRFHFTSFCICMHFFISDFCLFTACSLLVKVH